MFMNLSFDVLIKIFCLLSTNIFEMLEKRKRRNVGEGRRSIATSSVIFAIFRSKFFNRGKYIHRNPGTCDYCGAI